MMVCIDTILFIFPRDTVLNRVTGNRVRFSVVAHTIAATFDACAVTTRGEIGIIAILPRPATINYYNTRNTYPKIFLAELDSSALGKVATDEQLADPRCITAEVYAGDSSYREFTYSFDISDLGKTVPYVTLNKSNTFNKTQTAFVFDETMMSKAAFEVVGLIDALPAAANVTVRDKDAIEAARAAYEALTETQKTEVTNLDKLVAAEEAYAALP